MIYLNEEAWEKYLALMQERPKEFTQSEELRIITDREKVLEFEAKTGKTIGLIYQSAYNLLVVDLVQDKKGNIFAYERLMPAVTTGGGSVSVPVLDGNFILLRQYRHALRSYQYAFPRGFAEEGLTPDENIRKELGEELGATVKQTSLLGTMVSDSGMSGGKVSVFLCELESMAPQLHHEGIVGIEKLPLEKMSQWVAESKITDGYTLAAYGMLLNREKL